MSVNLNSFTTQQLQVLLNLVVSRIVDLDLHRKSWERYFDVVVSLSYEEQAPERAKEYETLQLFRVQILNAIVEVRFLEEVANN